MAERLSGRALATALKVDERAVRKAVEVGRINRGADGKFDLAEAREQWVRSTEPSRTKVRRTTVRTGPQSAPSADLPQAGTDTLWDIVADLPALAALSTTLHGGSLQLAFDVAADMALDIGGELRLRGFAEPPVDLSMVDWAMVADEADLAPLGPETMRADWQRRRDAD